MAAPLIGGDAGRSAWLPPGQWIDFSTGEEHEGSRMIEISPDHEGLPLFVKSGSVLPLAQPALHTDDPASRQLEVRIYGDGSLPAALLEEADPDRPYNAARAQLLELDWDAKSNAVLARRPRADLPAFYTIARQVKIDSFPTRSSS
jgi:alpha-D-xyloside xylohydrolase